jgi:hypothetical protein
MLDGHFFVNKFSRNITKSSDNSPWTPVAHRFFTMPVCKQLLSCAQAFPAYSHVVNDGTVDHDQRTVRTMVDLLRNNQWVNIFPEGGIYGPGFPRDKDDCLATKGGRKSAPGEMVAPCCWGTAKMICSLEDAPLVQPYGWWGPNDVFFQTFERMPNNNIKSTTKYQTGKDLAIVFGEPLDFREKIRRYREVWGDCGYDAPETAVKLALYEEITEEIRDAMLALVAEARQVHREAQNREERRVEVAVPLVNPANAKYVFGKAGQEAKKE